MGIRLRLSIKGTVRFLVLFSFISFMWWFFRSYVFLIALVIMVAGAAASAVLLWYSRDGICVRTVMYRGHTKINVRYPEGLDIYVDNPKRFSGVTADVVCWVGNVFTNSYIEISEHVWAAPVQGGCVHYGMVNYCAGRLEIEIPEFAVYDMFHIFKLTGCPKSETSMISYPWFDEIKNDDICSVVEGFPKDNESKKKGIDYNPDYEVREYIQGDELKNIHWKLSAKKEALMVRERLATGKEKINVVLPLVSDIDENEELMRSLYSLCRLLIKKEYPVQLFWNGYGGGIRTYFIVEEGEIDIAVGEILSEKGQRQPDELREYMSVEYPNEGYIEIRTGEYKGAFVSF